jgi:hypothetical protein
MKKFVLLLFLFNFLYSMQPEEILPDFTLDQLGDLSWVYSSCALPDFFEKELALEDGDSEAQKDFFLSRGQEGQSEVLLIEQAADKRPVSSLTRTFFLHTFASYEEAYPFECCVCFKRFKTNAQCFSHVKNHCYCYVCEKWLSDRYSLCRHCETGRHLQNVKRIFGK